MAQLPRNWIDALFGKFALFYGESFINKFRNVDEELLKNEWATALWKFDSTTLKAALEHCREESKHPPSLPEFMQMCKACRPLAERHSLLTHKFERSERADQFIADMKKMLEKGKV